MTKSRVEAFSDGVIAILITIMVLEFRPPAEPTVSALWAMRFTFLFYVLSFVYLGIYWNNHHHLLHATTRISGAVLWPNLHLLFWLSLVPFVTAWMGDHYFAALPTAVYGVVMLMAAVAWTILQAAIIRHDVPHSKLKVAVGSDLKGKISAGLYVSSIPLAFVHPLIADAIFVAVALIWLVPDRRIESHIT